MSFGAMLIRYFLAWFGMMVIAVLNGGLRDGVYAGYVSELAAHQISTVLLLILFGLYFWLLTAYWRIQSARQAWTIGLMWLFMTLAFEFGFFHYVAGHSWADLMAQYNVFAGRMWILVPLWVLLGPYVFYRIRRGV